MNLPNEAPKLNPLPFIIGDIALLVTAFLIATETASPMTSLALVAIVACVALGAILACIPIVLNYTRRRDAELDERQDQIVALTQTAAAAANQLSIAASNLHTISENSAKMLKHADQLPQRLQEKIAEFKTQLNEVAIAENEALEQEVNTLRASETERLDTALTAIRKTAGEIAALETESRKHAAELRETLARIAAENTDAAQKLASQTTALTTRAAAFETTRADAEKLAQKFADTQASAQTVLAGTFEKHAAAALARLETRFAELTRELDETLRKHDETLRATLAATATAPAAPSPAIATVPAEKISEEPAPKKKSPRHPPSTPRIHEQPPPAAPEQPSPETAPKAQEPETPEPPPVSAADDPAPEPPAPAAPPDPVPESEEKSENTSAPERPPEAEPPPSESQPEPEPGPVAEPSEPASPPAPPAPASAPRKRTPLKPRAPKPEEPMLDLDLPPPSDEYSQSEPDDGGFISAISADGVTRLIATAYIGIGNKLYIRGDGPGLSWEKGVPLQFISIGKWRWETHEAAAPVSFKLYKNDTVECTRIGSPKLEPGHQHEVTANF